jgi:hypothetical protein
MYGSIEQIPSKEPGLVAGWLRRVTLTYFIAVPLAGIRNVCCPFGKLLISIYLCDILYAYIMKTLSLKLDDNIFNETENVLTKVKKSRNRYINEAVDYYNRINKRNLIAKKLVRESKLVRKESLIVLAEFESLNDEN